jgi:hypothetical protein
VGRRRRKRRWRDLSPAQRTAIVAAGTVQLSLQAAALIDLRRRAREQVNGDRRAWALASFVNFLGPLAYFAFGRRRAG